MKASIQESKESCVARKCTTEESKDYYGSSYTYNPEFTIHSPFRIVLASQRSAHRQEESSDDFRDRNDDE